SWPQVYRLMAALLLIAAALSALVLPRVAAPNIKPPAARRDLLGFVAVTLAVAFGAVLTDRFGHLLASWLLTPILDGLTLTPTLYSKWIDLLALMLGLGFTLPLAAWAAR